MKTKHPVTVEPLYMVKKEVPFSVPGLVRELESNDILCPESVLAQMRLESSHFTSYLFKHANNLMGMRYPFIRNTTASGVFIPQKDTIIRGSQSELRKYAGISNTYAVYDTWQDAVKDYKLWQERCFNLNERYLKFLDAVYAEDGSYAKKIKQLATQ